MVVGVRYRPGPPFAAPDGREAHDQREEGDHGPRLRRRETARGPPPSQAHLWGAHVPPHQRALLHAGAERPGGDQQGDLPRRAPRAGTDGRLQRAEQRGRHPQTPQPSERQRQRRCGWRCEGAAAAALSSCRVFSIFFGMGTSGVDSMGHRACDDRLQGAARRGRNNRGGDAKAAAAAAAAVGRHVIVHRHRAGEPRCLW
mmetsp:Transcript_75239/g.151263  ORF Transcript_75239/g.151263 Transcript_75239/m.151263 type:complete len:200 (+) Transcript_75239:195-794(+)